ncbi:MAG: hypothetical protein ACE5I3_04620, partial [Phycisphaerae bacterium]
GARWSRTVWPSTQLNFLLAVPASRRKAWKLFLFRQGHLTDGPLLPDRKLVQQTPAWLAEALPQPPADLDNVVRMEQTWLVAHFLHHKEARTAIVEVLPRADAPPDLAGSLRDFLHLRQEGSGRSPCRP